MSRNTKNSSSTPKVQEDFLDVDPEIRGQEYVCLSFISPESVLKRKDLFFFQKFMRFYEAKIRFDTLESYLAEMINSHNVSVDDIKREAAKVLDDETKDSKEKKEDIEAAINRSRIPIQDVFDSFKEYVEKNRQKIAATENIQEAYDDFMFKKGEEFEEEFHQENDFRTSVRGLKIRGVYSTHKEACARAKKLQQQDPIHNVFVGQVGYWLPWDPEPSRIEEQEYAEKELNELMKKYKENQEKRKELFEAEKDRKVGAARRAVQEQQDDNTTENIGAAAAAAGGSTNLRVITESPLGQSNEQLRDIQEARQLMEQMDADRLSVDPGQARKALVEYDRERMMDKLGGAGLPDGDNKTD
jgi:hypothetical protein